MKARTAQNHDKKFQSRQEGGWHKRVRPNSVSIARIGFSAFSILTAIMLASGLSAPANACIQIVTGGCEMEQRQREEHHQQMEDMARQGAQEAADAAAASRPAAPPRPTSLQFAHGAIAWYTTSVGKPGIVVAAGEYDEMAARAVALSYCYHIGSSSCRIATTWYRGFAAVAEAEDGGLFFSIGDSKGAAKSAAVKLCATKASGCTAKNVYDNQGAQFYAD